MDLLKLQRAVSERKGDQKYCQEALSDLEYGLQLGSERAIEYHMRAWIYAVEINDSERPYRNTIREIWEEIQ